MKNAAGKLSICSAFNKPTRVEASMPALARSFGAADINGMLDKLTAPYFEITALKDFDARGQDPLVALRLDGTLERFLGEGHGLPVPMIDKLMQRMAETGSKRGVELCLKAGGGQDTVNVLRARQTALDRGHVAIAALLSSKDVALNDNGPRKAPIFRPALV